MTQAYRSLFVGQLVQESFLSVGGSDDLATIVDDPFCRDGLGRPTLRGSGLAGALVATLRRNLDGGVPVPDTISGSDKGRCPSVWRFFNSHQPRDSKPAYRQHVRIDPRTGAAARRALFNEETLPPGTVWDFMLEVDTRRDPAAAGHARAALAHWLTGRCLIGRGVARGTGWMRLESLYEYKLTTKHLEYWPNAWEAHRYPDYIKEKFGELLEKVKPARRALPGWIELEGSIVVGERKADDFGAGYGIDSLAVGGHSSDDLAAAWDDVHFLSPDGMEPEQMQKRFDPDSSVVMLDKEQQRLPYIPGSTLRGPLRHALARLRKAGGDSADLVDRLFGTVENGAKLLIRDALPADGPEIQLAWLQHHAEDEFAGGVYGEGKFDRVAVMQGCFHWKMVLEDASEDEIEALRTLFALAQAGHIGIGGGQWRGHGWPLWTLKDVQALEGNDD